MTAALAAAVPAPLRPARPGAAALLDAVVTYPAGSSGPVTSAGADDLARHWQRYGDRPGVTGPAGRQLIDTVEHLGLDGRGGGHFPVARKWRAHLAAGGGGVVVANGAESEPASAKDAALLQLRPHLVLDGLASAAEAVGAHSTIVWLHAGARAERAAVEWALVERRRAGLVEPEITVVVGPDRYLSGESGTIVSALSGGPARPGFRRVPATLRGVGGEPTLVHNVETLARTALAARPGVSVRTPTRLPTVATAAGRAVVEVPSTTPLWQVVDGLLGRGASRANRPCCSAAMAAPGSTAARSNNSGGRADCSVRACCCHCTGRRAVWRMRPRSPTTSRRAARGSAGPAGSAYAPSPAYWPTSSTCGRVGVIPEGLSGCSARSPAGEPAIIPTAPCEWSPARCKPSLPTSARTCTAEDVGTTAAAGSSRSRKGLDVGRHRRDSGEGTLHVNPVACDGIGICQHVAPTLIRADTWGYPIVSAKPLHGADKRAADAAAASCPRQALFVERI